MDNELSAEYEAALEASRAAYRTFDAIRTAYRSGHGTVDDATFLAARNIYNDSRDVFDVAYAKEQIRLHPGRPLKRSRV